MPMVPKLSGNTVPPRTAQGNIDSIPDLIAELLSLSPATKANPLAEPRGQSSSNKQHGQKNIVTQSSSHVSSPALTSAQTPASSRTSPPSSGNVSSASPKESGMRIAGRSAAAQRSVIQASPSIESISISGRAARQKANQIPKTVKSLGPSTSAHSHATEPQAGLPRAAPILVEDDGWTEPLPYVPKGWTLPTFNLEEAYERAGQEEKSQSSSTSPEQQHRWSLEDTEVKDSERTIFSSPAVAREPVEYVKAWKPIASRERDSHVRRPYATDSATRAFPNGIPDRFRQFQNPKQDSSLKPKSSSHWVGDDAEDHAQYDAYPDRRAARLDPPEMQADPWRASWENQRQGILRRPRGRGGPKRY